MSIQTVLLSPKVGELVEDEMAEYLVSQLPAVMARPSETVELRRGTVKAWGVELTSEDGRRAYKVAFIVEPDEARGGEVLTICALEEKTQLEAPVARRRKLKGWRMVTVGDRMRGGEEES